ncbi:hypothetical protein P0O24_11840 [Methanotrichaceae archaeon M04Ac]|uniref:Uncharacterized protein n=1 Tax=Candidatus Methanocrinis alkalitolerans TaxID=3033395 RepID=A0ABT5XHS7_9EURY|nr:hypothetical protein [Candidatus Methanocrinis alkalitolerans]MDF0594270.1 hypothetical protein [Candidatus Methanocrinis alkalitolerans]
MDLFDPSCYTHNEIERNSINNINSLLVHYHGMRHALLQGYTLGELAPEIGALVLFSAVLVPASLFAFRYAVRKAKMEGTLVHY